MKPASAPSSLAFKAIFNGRRTRTLQPIFDECARGHRRLRVHVIFTSIAETLEALRSATTFTVGRTAEIALLVPLTVPYPLPLENPTVSLGFTCRRISDLASSISSDAELEAYVYLCRNPLETLLGVLQPHSLVVIGVSRRWFFNKSRRIARRLRASGHEVVLINHG